MALKGNGFSYEVLYVPVKVILIAFYLNALLYRKSFDIDKSMLILMPLPLLISIIGYSHEIVNSWIVYVWQIQGSQTWRYGGIYGGDVNTLGMYSTLVLIAFYFAYKNGIVSFIWLVSIVLISFSAILVSGMRTGIIALIITALIYSIIRRSFFYLLPKIFLGCASMATLTYNILPNFIGDGNFEVIIKRVSLQVFMDDFNLDSDGNLTAAVNYYNSLVVGELNFGDLLIGYNSSIAFVDNFYIYIFIKYGMVGVILILFLFIWLIKALLTTKGKARDAALIMFIFTIIVSLKGIFVLGAYYVFSIIVILKIASTNNEKHSGKFL